jgi:pimeloyl-ACP methyl ester carboxylesterase
LERALIRKDHQFSRKFLFRALRLCFVAYVAACVGCASFQRKLIYYPPHSAETQVERYAATQRLDRWINPSGEPIGWKRLSPTQPAQARVLVMHGNSNGAFQCAHYPDAIQLAAPFDVFIVEYPGYENRPGAPTEPGLDKAADEAFGLLPTNRPIFLVGESLGTGVATYLAGRHPDKVAGVVLLAPYNHLSAVAQAHIRIIPVAWLLCDKFPSDEYLQTYHGPVAIMVSGKDRVVPERFGRRLYESYDGPKQLWEFPEGHHETAMYQPAEIWRQIIDFWQSHQRTP